MFIVCCVKRLLFVPEDYKAQKCEVEESITNLANNKHHIMMCYPKYHCELNNILHFWCSAKKLACENCNYTLNHLQQRIPCSLANVSNHTIVAYFYI